MCTVMCFTLFSLILGPFPQGLWMGFLNASGSLARAFGPLVISNLYASYGPRTVFAFVSCLNVRSGGRIGWDEGVDAHP